jgi:hypothetical protein
MNTKKHNLNPTAVLLTLCFLSVGSFYGCAKKNKEAEPATTAVSAPQAAALSIIGQYTDDYGGGHIITSNSWTMTGWGTSIFHIESFSESQGYLVAQNDSSNPYDPNLFSRFDYQKQNDGRVLFCQTTYNSPSLLATTNFTPANILAFDSNGCGSFPFSVLTPSTVAKAKTTAKDKGRSIASVTKGNLIPRRGPDSVKNVK